MLDIVVVDDRLAERNLLMRLARLVEADVGVRALPGAAAARAWIREMAGAGISGLPDLLVVTDRLPERDGSGVVRAFRALPGARALPVLLVVAAEQKHPAREALEAGASDIIVAPVDEAEFTARLRTFLTLRRQQKLLDEHAARAALPAGGPAAAEGQLPERQLRSIIDAVPALISAADAQGRLIIANQAHRRFYGVAGKPGQDLPASYGAEEATRHRALDARVIGTGQALAGLEHQVAPGGGSDAHTLLTTKAPLFDEAGRVSEVVTASLDVTVLKRAEARLRQAADHDPLTGLAGRGRFLAGLERALIAARRQGTKAAILLLDVDRFKGINDAFGLASGDLLLKSVADRLHGCLRNTDAIGRLGGDEFAILQTDIQGPDDPRQLARRLGDCFAEPFLIRGEELHSSASIGITLFPADGQSADRLLKNAELAMYRAKAVGRNGSCFFAPQMNLVARRTGLMERELHQALAGDQFTVHYQPQRRLADGRIVGMEALLRWRHPRRGMVRPSEFIGLIEEIGLITPMTERVLEQACRQLGAWQDAGLPPLRLSVNLSPVQFREPGVVELIERILEITGIEASSLEVELTEGVMLENSELVSTSLRRLTDIGVYFSLDDFGTGYSSLAHVRRLPVHRLKIDQSFVHRLGSDHQDDAIVRAIIDLGHSLDLQITAEGVETEPQLLRLKELGCDEAQGDLISPPLPAEAFAVLFAPAAEAFAAQS
jgi:diguanylate cyclase (GGDEF)-like protein